MKRSLLLTVCVIIYAFSLQAQVTQINSNKGLGFTYPLSNAKSIFVSDIDQTVWVTDGTLSGTFQLSAVIKYVDDLGSTTFLNGKYIFSGSTATTGAEVYITDGTPAGTVLLKDINPGATGSNPESLASLNGVIYFTAETPATGNELWRTDGTPAGTTLVKDINPGPAGSAIDFDIDYLNGFLYFTAVTAAEGRELWKTNGTTAGTTILKDVVPGPGDSNYPQNYELFSTGTYLLFMARTPSSGVELWRSDGSSAGTVLLKDINAGIDSSNARNFSLLNNVVLFAATDATDGDEIWKTDGTPAGTTLLKDINPGINSSTAPLVQIAPGISTGVPIFSSFHIFKNHAFFNASDGTSLGQVWSTDGTTANTILLKNIVQSASFPAPFVFITAAFDLPNKFIFPVSDGASRSEFWQSDGTPAGTILFRAFTPKSPGTFPFIFPSFIFTNGILSQALFQGNKFFFEVGTATQGNELWISDGVDGTDAHTHIVKDINPGIADSDPGSGSSVLYTTTAIFFAANNGTNGVELWRSDGTLAGTSIVKDINPGANDADPALDFFLVNGKILFEATDGDNVETDLYVIDGTFDPLPVSLIDFTVMPRSADALLQWHSAQELNTKNFTIQRSFDAQHFENIGIVQASGTSSGRGAYSFVDPGILNSGKSIVYYRLVSTDKDGKNANSNVISLKLNGSIQWNVHLLSNPVQDNVNVILSGITGKLQLSVRDISGKIFYKKSLENINGQISLPVMLQKGVYILEAENNNERKSIKFIK